MPTHRPLLLPAALALLLACPGWQGPMQCLDLEADECDDDPPGAAGTDDMVPTTSLGGEAQTDTGGSSTSPGPATTGQPDGLPSIVTIELEPNPIGVNGAIVVTVTTEFAAGVRMNTGLGTDELIELEPTGPDTFVGEIPVLTGLLNGERTAVLIPYTGSLDGDSKPATYKISLPKPGSEKKWETGDLIGPGKVVALATLPNGALVELGDQTADPPRCYLRMRTRDWLWAPADVVDLLPGVPCQAVDLKIDAQGALFVLVNEVNGDELRWRLLKLPAWGQNPQHVEVGAKAETAAAVALHAAGAVAVCGTGPTGELDEIDATVRIVRPGLPTTSQRLDYLDDMLFKHKFAEHPRDCIFIDDTLALVGEANGRHDMQSEARDRAFLLRLDTATGLATWNVLPPGDRTQGGAQAVDSDDEGRLILAGYTCDDECHPIAELRFHDENDLLVQHISLGAFVTKQLAVQDLVWSPAGYAVVATGGPPDSEFAFTVRAFAASQEPALWIYSHEDLQWLHFARALAIGPYAEVYAGGIGENNFPAVAAIAG